MQSLKLSIGAFIVALALPLLSQAATEPAEGTWTLNMSKSVFSAPLYKSQTRTYAVTAGGLSVSETTELASGGTQNVTYTYHYDGKDSAVTGSKFYDSVAVKRVGKRMARATLKLNGAVVGHSIREVSKDGKTLTLSSRLKIADKDVTSKMVFDKQ